MEDILKYIQAYGLPVFIIASCIIAILGILKLCKAFAKVQNANLKKFIYYVMDIALSFGGAAIYFAAFKEDFSAYIGFSIAQISATTTLYAIYENLGARKLVQMFFAWFGDLINKDNHNKLIKFAKSVGIENAIEELKQYAVKQLEQENKQAEEKKEIVEEKQEIVEEKKEDANISIAKEV